MTTFDISVEQLFDGESLLSNQTLRVENGVIKSLGKNQSDEHCVAATLIPGFIDVQVNGGGGCLFNQKPNLESIQLIGKAHQKFGTTGWLPTLVTDSFEKMSLAADAIALAIKNREPGVLGIHFEGPYLSSAKKGVHSEELIRSICDKEIALLTRADLGQVVITVAPENISNAQIKKLVSRNVIVCLGHSDATFEQTNQALKAGATGFTHLFNAMSAFTSREPGMVGAALLDEKSYAGIILDGIHVHPQTAYLASKQKKNLILVTDAMPPVGSRATEFDFFGQKINRCGDRLTDQNGRLAGSSLDMLSAVNNASQMLQLNWFDAVNLASKKPAEFLGLNERYGTLKKGAAASMLLLDENKKIISSWIDGIKII